MARPCELPILAGLLLLGLVLAPTAVRADELSDFEEARAHYNAMEYEKAVDAFMELVGTDPPQLRNALLVLESRKYLAAALVFTGRTQEAREQFVALLRAEPDYTIDPLAFPAEVVQLFDSIKRELVAEVRERERAEARAQARERAARNAVERERKARLRALQDLAEEEVIERRNSRWLATVPFGVGQIQNGQRALGRFLAVTEAVLLVASVTTWAVHNSLRNDNPLPGAPLDTAVRLERAMRMANYATSGAFIGLAAYGIADAHLRFVPKRTIRRRRELPPDLERWVEAELAAGGVRLRF